jgi:acyl-CoA dehydrogenase
MTEIHPFDADAFAAEVRAWLEQNCPSEMRVPSSGEEDICWGGKKWTFQSEAQKLWLERMAAKGWTVPTWPKEYGGAGLSSDAARVLKREMKRLGCRSPLESFGIWMLGPALLKYGTHEQKLRHLPPIARGEIRWAQGYSEPGAGSDLASLRTKAEAKGDLFLVNGQKVWTSYADKSDWIFALVRTHATAPKHQGISFLLIDMDQPGVTTRPIRLISGKSPFCETFFDDAYAQKDNLVGELDKGWTVAKYLLSHEREMIGAGGGGLFDTRSVGEIAAQELGTDAEGRLADPFLRVDAARLEMDAWAFMIGLDAVTRKAKQGGDVGASASMLKYYGTELNKRRHELLMDVGGSDGLIWDGAGDEAGKRPKDWLRTKGNSIEGGTSEIQLNIIAKHALGLPGV